MEKQAYDYYLESTDKENFVSTKATEWNITESELFSILTRQYQDRRAKEYPPYTLYLDGVVKNDQQQITDYINSCQSVKAKYPKP
jgi:hypothetical protein